jgi:hypothetical protein
VSPGFRPVAVPTALVLLAVAMSARAGEPGYEISVGVIETDNVERLPSGGTSNTIFAQQGSLVWHERGSLLSADIDADLSHLTYVPRVYSDEVIGNFIGAARLNVVPQLFSWDFTDNFGQGFIDPLGPLSPSNREIINYFSTGPQLLLPLSAANFLVTSASLGKVNYQTSPFDSTRYGATVGVLHTLSTLSTLSLNLHDERIKYTNHADNSDYDSQAAYLRYDVRGNRTMLDADIGYGRLRRANDTPSTVIAHLEISRRLTASSVVAAYFGHEYSDAAEAFRLTQTIGGANLNTQPALPSGTPFTSNYGALIWNFARNRTSWGLTASGYKDTYQQGAGLNDNRLVLDGNITRHLTPTLAAALSEDFLREHFETVPGSYSQSTTTLSLTWRMGQRLSLAVDYSFAKRQGDLPDTNFTENRLWISVGYGRPAQLPPGPAIPPTLRTPQTSQAAQVP